MNFAIFLRTPPAAASKRNFDNNQFSLNARLVNNEKTN